MGKSLIRLDEDGNLVLRSPGGKVRPLPTHLPGHCVVLLDCSSSMAGAKLAHSKAGVLDFSRSALAAGYAVGLVAFDCGGELVAKPTRELPVLDRALSGLQARGTTNLAAALEIACRQLEGLPGPRAVVIATDGFPNDPSSALNAARRAASQGIQIITIGTEDADHEFLSRIATASELSMAVSSKQLRAGIGNVAGLLPPVE